MKRVFSFLGCLVLLYAVCGGKIEADSGGAAEPAAYYITLPSAEEGTDCITQIADAVSRFAARFSFRKEPLTEGSGSRVVISVQQQARPAKEYPLCV